MAFSSSVPVLVAHAHTGVAGDGGNLNRILTEFTGIFSDQEMRSRADQFMFGTYASSGNNDGTGLAKGIAMF